jgi:hypothetical protein
MYNCPFGFFEFTLLSQLQKDTVLFAKAPPMDIMDRQAKEEELKRQFSNGDITVDQYTERLVSLLVWKELISSFDTQALFIALECQV